MRHLVVFRRGDVGILVRFVGLAPNRAGNFRRWVTRSPVIRKRTSEAKRTGPPNIREVKKSAFQSLGSIEEVAGALFGCTPVSLSADVPAVQFGAPRVSWLIIR